MVHVVNKGKRGEKELLEWLRMNLGIITDREYNQATGNSADVVVDDFIFEVKRRETLDLASWWQQVCVSKKTYDKNNGTDLIAVVAFRQNNKSWEFLISAQLIGLKHGYMRLTDRTFTHFAERIVKR